MKVFIVNTSEKTGGAAIAANRLKNALKKNGIDAKMLVRDKVSNRPDVVDLKKSWWHKVQFIWERVVIWKANKFKKHNLFAVDIANTGTDITSLPQFKEADVIHLHWINQGMLSLNDIKKILCSGKPVVWTMHDMWPCTAICHHARNCEKYRTECNCCPYLLNGGSPKDLSYQVFQQKQSIYSTAPMILVACSRWLKSQAFTSALLKGNTIVDIPNPIDTDIFNPLDKQEARRRCNLPTDKKLILFGSAKISDKRKGIDYFIESCKQLAENNPELKEKLGIVVYGKDSEQLIPLLPFKVYALNYISSEKELVDVYNSVDLFVTPSLEENLPNTIMEAMACGVPCVGFNIGGIPEMIDHKHNGYVATYKSVDDFTNGIKYVLSESDYDTLCNNAICKVATNYTESIVAQRYIEVYNQAISIRNKK